MEEPKRLTVQAVAWDEGAADMLRECFTVPGSLEAIAEQVQSGAAVLFVIEESGAAVGAFVLRVDGVEGVIAAAVGSLPMMVAMLPEIEARFFGCAAVRVHTARPALVKILRKAGYMPQEFVMRRELNGQQ